MIEETLRIETGHMTGVDVGIEIIEEDLVGVEETVDLGIKVDPPQGMKVESESVIAVEN